MTEQTKPIASEIMISIRNESEGRAKIQEFTILEPKDPEAVAKLIKAIVKPLSTTLEEAETIAREIIDLNTKKNSPTDCKGTSGPVGCVGGYGTTGVQGASDG